MKRSTMVAAKGPSTILLIIDPQVDFHEGGSLAVSYLLLINLLIFSQINGALKDSERLTTMIMYFV